VQTLERRQGLRIACPEEIRYLQGLSPTTNLLRSPLLWKISTESSRRGIVALTRIRSIQHAGFTLRRPHERALLEIWHIGYGPNVSYGLCVTDPNLYWTDPAERQPLIVRYGFPPGEQIECPGLVPGEGSICHQSRIRRAARTPRAHSSTALSGRRGICLRRRTLRVRSRARFYTLFSPVAYHSAQRLGADRPVAWGRHLPVGTAYRHAFP
jgi:hypothetical protein